MTKPTSTSKTARKQYTPEFRDEALKLAEHIGVAAAARELAAENARLKRQLTERDEELAILQKAATYFAKRLK
ncbi:transposase [Pectobacterium brasiliense]|nr:transposase [Pectobacterium brasiliense]GLY63381.1 transposase [Pectobacterium carotovorum subsp. carotovorum]